MRTLHGIRTQIAVTTCSVAAIAAVGVVAAVRYAGLDSVGTAAVDTVHIGNPRAAIVISATEDLQCPFCRRFEAQSGQTLTDLVASGQARIDYHIIAFLDRMSTTNYSSRAANASACVAAADTAKWPAWHTLMFQRQPKEHSDGLSDDQLVAIARQSGVSAPGVTGCIASGKYLTPIAAATKKAWANGLTQTPTVKVNGAIVTPGPDKLPTSAAITTAVKSATPQRK